MWNSKVFIPFLFLCLVNFSVSSPVLHSLDEGRGIGSTLWGWITYPFSWWSYGEVDDVPGNSQLATSSTNEPVESIEIGKRNVTVWCNDQTCTTMTCDKFGCTNLTCNIYDTELNGECRIYNSIHLDDPTSKPTEPPSKPLETLTKPIESLKPEESPSKPVESPSKPAESPSKPVELPSTPMKVPIKPVDVEKVTETDKHAKISSNSPTQENTDHPQERPIELEMMLSATVVAGNDTRRSTQARGATD